MMDKNTRPVEMQGLKAMEEKDISSEKKALTPILILPAIWFMFGSVVLSSVIVICHISDRKSLFRTIISSLYLFYIVFFPFFPVLFNRMLRKHIEISKFFNASPPVHVYTNAAIVKPSVKVANNYYYIYYIIWIAAFVLTAIFLITQAFFVIFLLGIWYYLLLKAITAPYLQAIREKSPEFSIGELLIVPVILFVFLNLAYIPVFLNRTENTCSYGEVYIGLFFVICTVISAVVALIIRNKIFNKLKSTLLQRGDFP